MQQEKADQAVRQITRVGGPLDLPPAQARLRLRLVRALASGRPVSAAQVDQLHADLELEREEVQQLLERLAERDAEGGVRGIMGLSLNRHAHRFSVDGVDLSTWCALDTLFLPLVLGQTAVIGSSSPLSGANVALTVGPERVEAVDPAGAVVSLALIDPDPSELRSVEALWSIFCQHVFFFPSEDEAERWAAGREDIAILSVAEAYELARHIAARCLAHGA